MRKHGHTHERPGPTAFDTAHGATTLLTHRHHRQPRRAKPVQAGDAIKVRLTVKTKTRRNDAYGEVRWHVTLTNQREEAVAEYELLTMNAL